ncbi:hypothetical protein Q2T76_01985 [Lactobacillus sp. YT155]|uniref:hypothetical protein n=1 Tax=Lactobacillus sp. YT155 TaxID=3060955 RepID=UPI00265ECDEF|nr:hypothetical protein [Lactobacillus sp. YT155]MDO1604819.1 hypothetical protein [Lactobacillus sp. YT155]
MTKKTKVIIASILVIILIVGCIIFFPKKSDRLTVTDIHNHVVLGKTTKKDLEERYGKPSKINTNKKEVSEIRDYWNGDSGEGTLNDQLDDLGYWESLKFDKNFPKKNVNGYEFYVQCSGKNLGVNYVRFFFWKDRVYDIQFGNKITNESAAKRDKYLKQIYGD